MQFPLPLMDPRNPLGPTGGEPTSSSGKTYQNVHFFPQSGILLRESRSFGLCWT